MVPEEAPLLCLRRNTNVHVNMMQRMFAGPQWDVHRKIIYLVTIVGYGENYGLVSHSRLI